MASWPEAIVSTRASVIFFGYFAAFVALMIVIGVLGSSSLAVVAFAAFGLAWLAWFGLWLEALRRVSERARDGEPDRNLTSAMVLGGFMALYVAISLARGLPPLLGIALSALVWAAGFAFYWTLWRAAKALVKAERSRGIKSGSGVFWTLISLGFVPLTAWDLRSRAMRLMGRG